MHLLFDPLAQFIALFASFLVVKTTVPDQRPAKFAAYLVFFLLLSGWMLLNGIEPYSTAPASEDMWHRLFFGFAKAVWWMGGATMLVSCVRLFLIFERRPREARLAQDLLAGIIYVGAALSVVAYVFSVPVGTLIATSGVFAVIIGLALQSTLSDVFSGIALNLGRPYTVGDWIVLDNGVQGRVMETNWRATYLLNGTNDLVIIPNSGLAKAQIVNLSSPDETHGIVITVKLLPTRPPAAIEQLLQTVLLSSNSILRSPLPSVTVVKLDGQSIEVELACRVRDASQVSVAKNEIFDLIYRHTQAVGIPLAADGVSQKPVADLTPPSDQQKTPWRLLKAMPLFSTLTDDERQVLANAMVRRTYKKGSEIIAQGVKSSTLVLIRSGVVMVERQDKDVKVELNRLSPGDFFGERGVLMDMEEPGVIRALTFVVTYEISAAQLSEVMQNRPVLAEELGVTLSHRLDMEKHLSGNGAKHSHHPDTIAMRIRHLFQIQHEPMS